MLEQHRLITRVAAAQAGNQTALGQLLRHYDNYVRHQVHKVASRWGIEHEDAAQEARIKLAGALLTFDLTREVPNPVASLNAFVSRTCWRAALRTVCNRDVVVMPINSPIDGAVVADQSRRLHTKGSPVTDQGIAARLGWTPGRVAMARMMTRGPTGVSLNAPMGDDEEGAARIDYLEAEDPSPEVVAIINLDAGKVKAVMATVLPPREVEAIDGHIMGELTLEEIGRRMGVTRAAVGLMVDRGLKKLRKALEAAGVTGITALAGE